MLLTYGKIIAEWISSLMAWYILDLNVLVAYFLRKIHDGQKRCCINDFLFSLKNTFRFFMYFRFKDISSLVT